MALLPSGEYKLNEKYGVCDKKSKSMVFVKLTDSAQRALNDYLKNPGNSKTPIIEFNKNDGRIFIPSSKGPNESAQFKFDVTSNVAMQGQQGRFECVQQKCGSKHLIKTGQLTHRLRIHANEDVFEKTKNRMAAIELEQRKNCTREIDWNFTSGLNRKVRIDRFTKLAQGAAAAETPPSAVPSKITSTAASILNRSLKLASNVNNRDNRLDKSLPSSTKITQARRTSVKPKPNVKSVANPALLKRPIKERMIHMLALRPHKKLELFAALRKEGLRESDKTHLMHTLVSISTQRDNTYQLLRHLWNDVQEDWPFYTEQELQQMKRNKPQNLTPPSSDSGISVGSNQSPHNSTGDKSPSCQYKRPGYFHGADGLQTKRHRISHYNRPSKANGNEEMQISASQITNCFDEVIEKSGLFNTAVKNAPLRPNYKFSKSTPPVAESKNQTQKELKSVPDNSAKINRSIGDKRDAKDLNIVPHSDMYSSTSKMDDRMKTDTCDKSRQSLSNIPETKNAYSCEPSSSVSPLPLRMSQMKLPDEISDNAGLPVDYEKVYTTITNSEQRRKYKDDFNSIFGEYQKAADKVAQINTMFAEYRNALQKCEKASLEAKRIEREICIKYEEVRDEFQATKQRHEFLYAMLSHIKQLVSEYDEKVYL